MSNNQDLNRLEVYLGETHFHEKWLSFFIIGIVLILLGSLTIVGANYATIASIIFFGSVLAVGGILQFIYAFWARKGEGFFQNLLSALFYATVGLVLITHPTASALAITLVLAAFFCVSGIFKIVVSLATPVIQWGWLLVSGIISLALGILIWAEWPMSGFWLIGLFIGIDLIFIGWFWIMLSLVARKLPEKP